MKSCRYIFLAFVVAVTTGCMSLNPESQYSSSLHTLTVNVVFPSPYESYLQEGIEVKLREGATNRSYSALTDSEGKAVFQCSDGFYNVGFSMVMARDIFNASADQVKVTGDLSLQLEAVHSTTSTLIIKEIYCGGCTKEPEAGTFALDKYIIIHNNAATTQYLDGLCFGMIEPYNSQATNAWLTYENGEMVYPDFVPLADAIWVFDGAGEDFPLAAGEDAVVAVNGAIDHTLQYPNSVNLNNEAYYVCYNNELFPNTSYHPVPGDKIPTSHYLRVVTKYSGSTAFPMSQVSPGLVLFKSEGMTIDEYVQQPGVITEKPGSTTLKAAKLPLEWVLDAVEVFTGTSSDNRKRFRTELDSGWVTLSSTYKGYSLHRNLDEAESAARGYEFYMDTNNSTSDFYERERASLKDVE